MSFPKAKITRFNEITDCTPSPAEYNPMTNDRKIGGVISDKGSEKDENASVQSTSSSRFKTPTSIKKSKPSTSKVIKSQDSEALKEKIVECENKDAYIKELLDQLVDLKDQTVHLQSQKDLIEKECDNFKLELDKINDTHSLSIQVLKTCFTDDQNSLNDEIRGLTVECSELHKNHLELRNSFSKEFAKLSKTQEAINAFLNTSLGIYVAKLEDGSKEIAKKEKELVLLKDRLEAVKFAHQTTIEIVYQAHRETIKCLEKKIIKKIQEIKNTMLNGDEIGNNLAVLNRVDVKDEEVQTESKLLTWKSVKNELKMYTETYVNDLAQNPIKKEQSVIVTSPNEKHTLKTNLKMKFYPIENINEVVDDLIDNELSQSSQNTSKDIKNCESLSEAPNFQSELKKMYKRHENECKLSKNNEINALKKSQTEEIEQIKKENESHLQQIKENYDESIRLAKIQVEEECKVNELAYKVKLENQQSENDAVLEECKKIGEYTIFESETERKNLKREVDEIKTELSEEQKKKNRFIEYKKLCKDYDSAVIEYRLLEKKLLNALLLKELEKKQLKNDHFTYNITIHKTRETIDALTKRLIESDNDVIQLKNEINQIDKNTINYEEKKIKLNEELNVLTKENEDLNLQKESMSKLYENDLKDFEKNLLKTVDEYKESVSKMLNEYKIKLETTEYDLQEVIKCLYEQEVVNSEAYNLIHLANNEIEDLEKNNRLFEDRICVMKHELEEAKSKINKLVTSKKIIEEKLKFEQLQNARLQEQVFKYKLEQEEIECLRKQVDQLNKKKQTFSEYCDYYSAKAEDYEKVVNEMNEINRNYIDQTQKYENLVQKCDEICHKNDELQRIAAEKEILIGPFKEQLENYKHEWQSLITQKADAENEARAIGMRYAEVLGHQNQKQKIKHIVDLKEKHFTLLKENQTLESKLRSQTKMIEKLKAELGMVGKPQKKKKVQIVVKEKEANKENSFHENFASPLRDRNRDE